MSKRLLVIAWVAGSALLGLASPAAAHTAADGGANVQMAQTIAGEELTVVIRPVHDVPGPLYVDLIAHEPVLRQTVDLTVRSTTDGRTSAGTVRLESNRAGMYSAVLRVGATGAHQLELRAAGEVSRLPFRVLTSRPAPWELLVYGGLASAGLLFAGALVIGTRFRPAAVVGGGAAAVAVVVAATTGMLSSQLPPARPNGSAPVVSANAAAAGRPYVLATVATTPAHPRVGEVFTLSVDLFDGSTGSPVDDLVVHHAALAHAVVTSLDGTSFEHVHPIRPAPGRMEVRLRAARPGRHLINIEFERENSGGQMVAGQFTVYGGDATGQPAPPRAPAASVAPSLTPATPIAGRPAMLEVDAGAGDLQPWLGMAGHLIVRSGDGGFLGHAHEMSSMSAPAGGGQAPDETVARYGPRLRFTFSFPAAGRYFAWIQFVRDYRVVTVPFTVDVVGEEST